jgi:hypothetical protein
MITTTFNYPANELLNRVYSAAFSPMQSTNYHSVEESIAPFLESYGCDEELIKEVTTAVVSSNTQSSASNGNGNGGDTTLITNGGNNNDHSSSSDGGAIKLKSTSSNPFGCVGCVVGRE